ncbi:HNH endonuclease signature motif containing protein [Luethyella okanaganae]|uniref:DUF222 domain-containing protein n=1 Tax=Luethyella okanaganae TaxID=69372 RepID=A0ABW1VH30_9MICO
MNSRSSSLHQPDSPNQPGSPDAWLPTFSGAMSALIGRASDDDRIIAMMAANRAASIERARAWAMISDEVVVHGPQLTAARREEWVRRSFVSEMACALQLPERSAERLIDESEILVRELTRTLDALANGDISYRHAQVVIDQARTLPSEARVAFEAVMLTTAATATVAELRRAALRERERMHPESIASRRRTAVEERRVALDGTCDGMAWLHHHLPIEQAVGVFNRITAAARSLQGSHESRTLDQLRADVAASLLLDGDCDYDYDYDYDDELANAPLKAEAKTKTSRMAALRGIRPTVIVTVPVLTLLGHGDEPAELAGHGPIDADTARELAARAPSFTRLLTHPETGAVLSIGRESYTVPADLKRWLLLRDERCRFPGCGRPAQQCELDHTVAWQHGGRTDGSNLAFLCRKHHRLKHLTHWQARQDDDGVLDWRSPSRRQYRTRPAVRPPGSSPPRELPKDPPF